MIEYLGNKDLLKEPLTAFFAPSRIEPESVLPTLDWATKQAREKRVVVSGFSSRLETDVFDIFVRKQSPMVMVVVRKPYSRIPTNLKPLLDSGQLLIVFLGIGVRLARQLAARRNRYVANLAEGVVFATVNADSSLFDLHNELALTGKPITILWR